MDVLLFIQQKYNIHIRCYSQICNSNPISVKTTLNNDFGKNISQTGEKQKIGRRQILAYLLKKCELHENNSLENQSRKN